MTSRDLLWLLIRRWYLMVLGAAASLAFVAAIWQQQGVYWTQFDVVVLAPRDQLNPNEIEDPRFSITPMAGVLVTLVNGEDRPRVLASSSTTLYGEGLTQGSRVRLPNSGSQWRPLYYQPVIDVQVVDPDEEVVARKSREIADEIDKVLARQQEAQGIRTRSQMSTIVSPSEPVISYIPTSRTRAALGAALFGALATSFLVWALERARLRWRPAGWLRRAPTRSGKTPAPPEPVSAGL